MSDQMKFDTDQDLAVGRAGSLANILVMTEEMLESARNDQWDDVTEMEERRRQALSECFGAPIPEEALRAFYRGARRHAAHERGANLTT
jgi:hypothetical protein